MESPILMLVFGIAVGVLLTAKPVKELVTSIDEKAPAALPYVVFGFLLFAATWALHWLGFIVVVTTFGLYQVFGSSDLGQKIKTFFKFGWLKRKKKTKEVDTSGLVVDPRFVPDLPGLNGDPAPTPPAERPVDTCVDDEASSDDIKIDDTPSQPVSDVPSTIPEH